MNTRALCKSHTDLLLSFYLISYCLNTRIKINYINRQNQFGIDALLMLLLIFCGLRSAGNWIKKEENISLLSVAILRFGTSTKPRLALIWIIELLSAFITYYTNTCASVVVIKAVSFLWLSNYFSFPNSWTV